MYRTTTSWHPGGTWTFRQKSTKLFGRWGGNLQNLSKPMKSLIIPDDGKVLVNVDEFAAEALIMAYLMPKGNALRELLFVGIKPHVYMAMHIFKDDWVKEGHDICIAACATSPKGLPKLPGWIELQTAIKNHDKRYFLGKKVIHASNYGMHGQTFRDNVLKETQGQIVLDIREANRMLSMYHELVPELAKWQKATYEQARDTKILYNLFGYPITFTGRVEERDAYAAIPQSTVGCLGNQAFIEEQEYIETHKKDWDLLINCHDSTLTQCPEGEVEECVRIKQQIVEKEFVTPAGESFKMRSEAQVGKNYKEMIEYLL